MYPCYMSHLCTIQVDMEFKSEGDYSVTSADETSIQEINAAVDGQRLTEDNRRLLNVRSERALITPPSVWYLFVFYTKRHVP